MTLTRKLLVGAVLAAVAIPTITVAAPGDAAGVNKKCPMSQESTDPCITVDFKGRAVTFCCADCVSQWAKLTPGEREARLAAVSSDPGAAGTFASPDALDAPRPGPCFPTEPWPCPPTPVRWPYPKPSQPLEPWCWPVAVDAP